MYCEKCGKKGFPVRIACFNCNATLPDVPAVLESPEERGKPKNVVCEKCGQVAVDGRIACEHCDTSFPRPLHLISGMQGPEEADQSIDRYVFIASKGACPECARLNGKEFRHRQLHNYPLPVQRCINPVCRCSIVGRYDDEGVVTLE